MIVQAVARESGFDQCTDFSSFGAVMGQRGSTQVFVENDVNYWGQSVSWGRD